LDALTNVNIAVLLGGALLVAGIVSSLIAARLGAPLLLIFLVIGMLLGEDGPARIVFNDYAATYLIGSVALAVILFDGGLRMRLSRFRGALAPAAALSSVGVAITAGIVGVAAAAALKMSLAEGLLIGAIVASTDAAAVLFLLSAGRMQLRRRVGATLEIESGTNDPAALLLTIMLVEIVRTSDAPSALAMAELLAVQVLLGGFVGIVGGLVVVAALNRLALPAGLPPLLVVASAVSIYGLAAVCNGSGFLAVYLAGLVVGNRPVRGYVSVLRFHDAVTWLAQACMFLVLGLLVTPSRLLEHLVPALAVSAVLILVARPLAVWLCLAPFGFSTPEKAFVSWVGLRGAVSIFLASIPTLTLLPNAQSYFDVAFVVVLVSLTLQGASVAWAARWTRVSRHDLAPAVRRAEIDLPIQLNVEMVGYPIQEGSYVLARGRLPRWLRPVLVLKDGQLLPSAEAGALAAGDFAYFLAPRNRLRLLDRIFAPADPAHAHAGDGLFSFRGGTSLGDIARLYGVESPEDLAGKTIAEAFAARYELGAELGDRIEFGPGALVAAAAGAEGVTLALLDLEPRGAVGHGYVATAAARRIARGASALWRGTFARRRRRPRRATRDGDPPAAP
jgi:cell volume regulation protein A